MLWYLLFALVFFSLALFAAHFHKHATAECRSIRLTRGGVLSVVLLGIIGFYPLLILYFRLYPVSSSNHLTVTMSAMLLTITGLLLGLFPARLTRLKNRPWQRQQMVAMLVVMLACLIASGLLMRLDMASGSLFSWWSPLCIVLFIIEALCWWTMLLQIPVRFGLRNLHQIDQP